jgi:L-cysteine S-thiosulfotransferase
MTMRKLHHAALACAVGAIMLSGNALAQATATPAAVAAPAKEETGKQLAFNNRKGNCLACHGPPLIAMSARFPDKAKLRAQIWDATAFNPSTSMIPFGKHGVLTEAEIDKVTDFVYGL